LESLDWIYTGYVPTSFSNIPWPLRNYVLFIVTILYMSLHTLRHKHVRNKDIVLYDIVFFNQNKV